MAKKIITKQYTEFVEVIKARVLIARRKAVQSVNQELILLYHHIGEEILNRQKENGWGAKIVDHLSEDLRNAFPEMKGFSSRNLKYMRKFAEEYPDLEFVQQVAAQLPWFHIVLLIDKVKIKGGASRIYFKSFILPIEKES